MYTKQALRELGVPANYLTDEQKEALDRNGFFLVPGVFSEVECQEMGKEFDRLHRLEGEQGGHEVHIEPGAPRVSNIFNKSEKFDRCLECKVLLAASHYLLGEFKVHGANLREPLKGMGHQDLHADVPKLFKDDWWVSNAIFTFDDMTLDNGPTRVIPGSHHWPPLNVATVNQGNWVPSPLSPEEQKLVPEDLAAPYEGEVRIEAPAGSVVVINSSLWHSGTTNTNGSRRRVLHLTYTRRDLPQQLYQRDFLTEALYKRMSPVHRFLLDIEPLKSGADETGRMPKIASKEWWN